LRLSRGEIHGGECTRRAGKAPKEICGRGTEGNFGDGGGGSSGKFSATAQVGRGGKGLKEERRDEERQ